MSNRIEELFLELAPTGRGYDDSSKRPIEYAPQSCGTEDSRRLARAIAGSQGCRMAGLNMTKSFPLPLVGPNSKNAERIKWKYDGTTNWNGPALTPSARFDRRRCRGLRRPVSETKGLLSVGYFRREIA
jgi:hypothetical protein